MLVVELVEVEVLVVVMALGGPLAGSNIIEETTWQVSVIASIPGDGGVICVEAGAHGCS